MVWTSFWGVFSRYVDRKTTPIQKTWKIEKPYKTLAMPAKMEMILLHIWRPNSSPNYSKSTDFPHQNLEANKCKTMEAFTAREGWTWRHFWSLGGRGETTKHRTHAQDLTTPMGQCPGEFSNFDLSLFALLSKMNDFYDVHGLNRYVSPKTQTVVIVIAKTLSSWHSVRDFFCQLSLWQVCLSGRLSISFDFVLPLCLRHLFVSLSQQLYTFCSLAVVDNQ